jgi:hypothetical protein
MGKMKELYMELRQIHDDEIPEDITIRDMAEMNKWNRLQWEEYKTSIEKARSIQNVRKERNKPVRFYNRSNSNIKGVNNEEGD